MGFLAGLMATVGAFVANLGSQACYFLFFDEIECPKSLVK